MRHVVNLILGEGTAVFAKELHRYAVQYGEGDAAGFIQSMAVDQRPEGCCLTPIKGMQTGNKFCSVLDDRFAMGMGDAEVCRGTADLKSFFAELYSRTVL